MARSPSHKRNPEHRYSPMGSRRSTRLQSRGCVLGDNSTSPGQTSSTGLNNAAVVYNASLSVAIGAPLSPPPERPLPPLPEHAVRSRSQLAPETGMPPTNDMAAMTPPAMEGDTPVLESVEQGDLAYADASQYLEGPGEQNSESGSWGVYPVEIPPETRARLQQVGTSSSCAHGQALPVPRYRGHLKYRRYQHMTEDAEEHERHEYIRAAYFPGVPYERIIYWQFSYGCVLRGGNGSNLHIMSTTSTQDGGIIVPAGVSVAIFNTTARLVSLQAILDEEDDFMPMDVDEAEEDLMENDMTMDYSDDESDESDYDDLYDIVSKPGY